MEKATFGAGCFWGVEANFRRVNGVMDVEVGYAGGNTNNPTYQDVCSGITGHAEVVEVHFDPNKVTYEDLLEVFWNIHDPTTLNRQGPDFGTQYRSAILFHSEDQLVTARKSLERQTASGRYENPMVTEITEHEKFNRAEEYHQKYFEKLGRN